MSENESFSRVAAFLAARREILGELAAEKLFITTIQQSSRSDPLALTQADLEAVMAVVRSERPEWAAIERGSEPAPVYLADQPQERRGGREF